MDTLQKTTLLIILANAAGWSAFIVWFVWYERKR